MYQELANNHDFSIAKLSGAAFLPFSDMRHMLEAELRERLGFSGSPSNVFGELLYYEDFPAELLKSQRDFPYWSKCTLLEPLEIRFRSIGTASSALRSIQRSWAPYSYQFFRRGSLIQEKLPFVNLKEKVFPQVIPSSPIGLYSLIEENRLIASGSTSSFLPAGEIRFKEDHVNPPSRAYLKLQESLTMANILNGTPFPKKGDRCFDAGAAPGGWTWVLVNLGAFVLAVDRAELSCELMKNPSVEFRAHDAFTLKPSEVGECDWVFSDVICYPERLLKWINGWLESGLAHNMICTIKMQGKTDWNVIKEFANIPESRIVHLNYNKHELTWIHTKGVS